jgi:hypothetical protein
MKVDAHGVGFGVSAFLLLLFGVIFSCVATVRAGAQQSPNEYAVNSESADNSIQRTWQIGGFAAGGFPPYYTVHAPLLRYREELLVYNASLEDGR